MTKASKGVMLKEYLESLDSVNVSQTTPKNQEKVLLE